MRTRLAEFLNTETFEREYGVYVYYKNKWCLLAVEGCAFVVKTVAEASAKRAEIRKEKWTW